MMPVMLITHKDEDTPTSITTTDVTTLDGVGAVLHQTKTHLLHICSHYSNKKYLKIAPNYISDTY